MKREHLSDHKSLDSLSLGIFFSHLKVNPVVRVKVTN